ncbi:MAG: hypothetical protein WB767_03575, partial [Nocardioides sp.]
MSEALPGFVSDFVARGDAGTRVGLAFADVVDLRAASPRDAGRASAVGVFVAEHDRALTLVPRPDWPSLKAFRSVAKAGGRWT